MDDLRNAVQKRAAMVGVNPYNPPEWGGQDPDSGGEVAPGWKRHPEGGYVSHDGYRVVNGGHARSTSGGYQSKSSWHVFAPGVQYPDIREGGYASNAIHTTDSKAKAADFVDWHRSTVRSPNPSFE